MEGNWNFIPDHVLRIFCGVKPNNTPGVPPWKEETQNAIESRSILKLLILVSHSAAGTPTISAGAEYQ